MGKTRKGIELEIQKKVVNKKERIHELIKQKRLGVEETRINKKTQ